MSGFIEIPTEKFIQNWPFTEWVVKQWLQLPRVGEWPTAADYFVWTELQLFAFDVVHGGLYCTSEFIDRPAQALLFRYAFSICNVACWRKKHDNSPAERLPYALVYAAVPHTHYALVSSSVLFN